MFPLCSEFIKKLYTLVLVQGQPPFYLNFIFRKYYREEVGQITLKSCYELLTFILDLECII